MTQGKKISEIFGISEEKLLEDVRKTCLELKKIEARHKLAKLILEGPVELRYAPPETKGMLIYQLSNDSFGDWARSGFGIGENYLANQKAAIQYILKRWSHTRSDFDNIIQHMSHDGVKGNYSQNLSRLRRFFSQELPGGRDLPGIDSSHSNDFDIWVNQLTALLKNEPTPGFPVVASDSIQYAMQRDHNTSHPLFASTGKNSFYA